MYELLQNACGHGQNLVHVYIHLGDFVSNAALTNSTSYIDSIEKSAKEEIVSNGSAKDD